MLVNSNASSIQCSICRHEFPESSDPNFLVLEPDQKDLTKVTTKCQHVFHRFCLNTVLDRAIKNDTDLNCPQCNFLIIKKPKENYDNLKLEINSYILLSEKEKKK